MTSRRQTTVYQTHALVVGDRVLIDFGARVAVVELVAVAPAGVTLAVRGPNSRTVQVHRSRAQAAGGPRAWRRRA